jgi:predicted transcriptional regulator of viral defense system
MSQKKKNIKKLPKKPFTYQQAKQMGITRHYLREILKQGKIERLSRGVYKASSTSTSDDEEFRDATLRIGKPCAICLISALAYYNLTDTIPRKIWVMAPVNKRTLHKDIKVFRTRNPNWSIGVIQQDGFNITSLERTIIDCLVNRNMIGSNIAIEALRLAINEKKTTLKKIIEIAKSLKVYHRIQSYIEVLA